MRLRAVLVPTDTVLATLASEPLPIATESALDAIAALPIATAAFPLANENRPNAELLSPEAVASVPIAVLAKMVFVLKPTEVPKSADALFCPTAIERKPLARGPGNG